MKLLWTLTSLCCSLVCSTPHDEVAIADAQDLQDSIERSLQSDVADPFTSVEISYPLHGAVEKPPVQFSINIKIRSSHVQELHELYRNKSVCYEVNATSWGCHGLDAATFELTSVGTSSVRVYLSDTDGDGRAVGRRYWQTPVTTFSVVDEAELEEKARAFVADRQARHRQGYDLSLDHWASLQQRQRPESLLKRLSRSDLPRPRRGDPGSVFLLIGVKTSVVTNFALRQAIRETWASSERLPSRVKVFFVGCRPFTTLFEADDDEEDDEESTTQRELWHAIELEKMVYGDLLTDELDCNDAYVDLANKVKEFLHFAATTYSAAQYVMIADDDLYVRVDELVEHLERLGPQARHYSGQVPSIQHARKDRPTREAGKRFSLSRAVFPLSETPPFAMGAYFFLSMDCVRFISKNRHRLRDLNGMDDLTVALWMFVMGVHAQHTERLGYLRSYPCRNSFLAFGDLSPLAIREVHSNLMEQRPFCHGFDRVLWLKAAAHAPSIGLSQMLPLFSESLQVRFGVVNAQKLGPIEIVSAISSDFSAGIKVLYSPSRQTFAELSRLVCAESRLSFSGAVKGITCSEIARDLRNQLRVFYSQVLESHTVESSRLALWGHNLFTKGQARSPMVVAYSPGAAVPSIIFESIFASMQHDRPIVVVDEVTLDRKYGGRPDVFVFSILDGCKNGMPPECKRMVSEYLDKYSRPIDGGGNNTLGGIIMISGERHDVDGLDERVLLLSTVANVPRDKHIYLSMASMSFAKRLDHDPTALLVSQGQKYQHKPRRFCAYMYARCGRIERELMYDLLNEVEPVDALGKCAGRANIHTSRGSRPARYNDDAVNRYQNYKFVIAFENAQAPGYVTEKLVNAFLAGSVPIYYGNSTTVSQLFNPSSFIDCGLFPAFQDCARYVLQVHTSPDQYAAMLREAPITDVEAFEHAFSWHPAVASSFHAEELVKHLRRG